MSRRIRIVGARIEPWTLKLEPPIRGTRYRRGWQLRLVDSDGRSGRGDAAPWPGEGEALAVVEQRLRTVVDTIVGSEIGVGDAQASCAGCPEATAALETALLDCMGELDGAAPRWNGLAQSAREARDALDAGASAIKVKVGDGRLEADDALLAAIRAEIGPDVPLRIDVNGALTPPQAISAIERLSRHGLEYVEEPTSGVEGLRTVRAAVSVPIAADESVRTAQDLEALIAADAADLVVLKPMLTGLLAARRMAERAIEAGLGVIVTHALETSAGRASAAWLAAQMPGDRAHGVSARPDAFPAQAEEPVPPTAIPNPAWGSGLARPEHPALIRGDEVTTWGALAKAAARRGHVLRALGLQPKQTVGLVGETGREWLETWHAIAHVGGTVAPMSVKATPEELEIALEVSQPEVVVAVGDAVLPRAASVARLTDAASLPMAPERFWPLDEARVCVLTSGTTGRPRAVRLTTLQWMTSAFGSAVRLGHDPADVWLCCLPLHHVAGISILVRTAFYGTTTLLARVGDERATLVSLVPTQLERWLDRLGDAPAPSRLRAVLVGGGPTSATLVERARARGLPLAVSWGMTEAASQIATRPPHDRGGDDEGSDCGPPLPFARVDEVDGVLVVRGPVVRGVLASRDRGRVDASGRVAVLGRCDDVILSGGENIDPAEVEAVLRAHPAVDDVAVVGAPDARWGMRPVAVMEGSRGADEDALREWCAQSLSGFKVPDRFRWVDALPRTALGKVKKHDLEVA